MRKATGLVGVMVGRIMARRIKVEYILMDSRFGWRSLISEPLKCAPVTCMVKRTEKIPYGFAGGKFDVMAICRGLKKRPGKAKIVASAIVAMPDGTPGQTMAKRHLKLSGEIQAKNFDSLIAHTTIVFKRYRFLAFEQRMRADNRTFGDMFYACRDELGDISPFGSFRRILALAADRLRNAGEFAGEAYRALIDAAIGEAMAFCGLGKLNCIRSQEII